MRKISLPNGKTLQVPDDLSTEEEHQIIGQELNPAFGGTATQYQAPGQAQAEPMTVPQPQPVEQPAWRPSVLPTLGTIGAGIISRGNPAAMALGGMGGRALNAPLGIEPFNPSEVARTGEETLIGGPIGAVAKAAYRTVSPWMTAAMNRLAPEQAAALLGKFQPVTKASDIFEQAKLSPHRLPLTDTLAE